MCLQTVPVNAQRINSAFGTDDPDPATIPSQVRHKTKGYRQVTFVKPCPQLSSRDTTSTLREQSWFIEQLTPISVDGAGAVESRSLGPSSRKENMLKTPNQKTPDGPKNATEDAEPRKTKSKRSSYVRKAWFVLADSILLLFSFISFLSGQTQPLILVTISNECKRRKVKCDGQVPCGQCDAQLAQCSYRARRQNSNLLDLEWVL